MSDPTWQRVKELFQAALERTAEERASLLDEACGDPELRREAQGLLAAHAELGDFMETPLAAVTPIAPGTRLGPYEIRDSIGRGGMSEVYRGRDTRLERDVAVKVLPRALAADPDRRRRFEQEARAASALNHSNIVAVYDTGSHDGMPFLVTELLDGEPLADRLAHGPFSVRKALECAVQAARGLAAAHGRGIVHCDLKPANLFLHGGGTDQDPGLRNREAGGRGRSPGARPGLAGSRNPSGARPRHGGLHVAGAGAGRAGGRSLGPVLPRVRGLRAPLRQSALPPPHRGADHGRGSRRRAAGSRRGEPACPASRGLDRRALPRQGSRGSLQRHAGPGERSGARPRPASRAHPPVPGDEPATRAPEARAFAPGSGTRRRRRRRLVGEGPPARGTSGPLLDVLRKRQLARGLAGRKDDRLQVSPRRPEPHLAQAARDGRRGATHRRGGRPAEVLARRIGDPFIRRAEDGSSLYRVPSVGGEPRKIVDDALYGDFSPDGRSIAFVRQVAEAEGVASIVALAAPDGSGVREIARLEGSRFVSSAFMHPRWSPDGRTLAATPSTHQLGDPNVIALLDVASGKIDIMY